LAKFEDKHSQGSRNCHKYLMRMILSDSAISSGFRGLFFLLHAGPYRCDPVIHDAVALEAVRREPLCLMIRRFGFPIVIEMTAATLGREPLPVERSHGPYFVTGVAVDGRVRPNQRKPVHVLVDVVGGYLPASVSMTHVALRSVLAAVNIGMAVLALLAYIREHWIRMALLTVHLRM